MTAYQQHIEQGTTRDLFRGVTTKPTLANHGLRRLVLTGCCSTNAATLLKWARSGYDAAAKTKAHVGPFVQIFADGFNLGAMLAEALLRGEIPVEIVDDDSLHILLNKEQVLVYVARMNGITPIGEATLLSE
jgi:hypothetical protein